MTSRSEQIEVGTVVRDRKWGNPHSGTVVRREGRSVFVAWHGSFVEDELDLDEVEFWVDAPGRLRRWRGGVGVFQADGSVAVESVSDGRS